MKSKYLTFTSLFLLLVGCTDLNEVLYDRLSTENFYKTKEEVLSGLTNVYLKQMVQHNYFWLWNLQECTTGHGMVPARDNGGWYDGGVFMQLYEHNWDATHPFVSNNYKYFYSTIAAANSFLDILKRIDIENKETIIAEVKAIRAWDYLLLIDLYGNVPLVTDAKLNPQNLPTNSTRKQVFEFLEGELKQSIELLPSIANISNRDDYYPRITKEAAQAMLVRLYLNAEVYSGTARWQDCINISDKVINSGGFSLAPSISDNFVPLNQGCREIIFAISQDNIIGTSTWQGDGNTGGFPMHQWSLRGQLKSKYNIKFNPWGGPSVLKEGFDIYDNDDYRKTLILSGVQRSQSGDSLTNLVPINNLLSAKENEGFVNVKYSPDPESIVNIWGRGMGRNDIVLIRYADILMSKAEALYRLGKTEEATSLINIVRARNFSTPKPFVNMTLNDILQERSREFFWECTYRTDLIRFGKFITERKQWKDYDDNISRNLFPIPQNELQTNPKLVQNPGY